MKIRIKQDNDPLNPRTEFDNAGTMVCFHRRYNLGDKHDFSSPDHFKEEILSDPENLVLPLYLYDHSGITMRTTPFECPWDSGQVGWIYATPETMAKEKLDREQMSKLLRSEVEVYDQYLTGDVWGYIIEDDEGNELDSCWGFYGRDYCEQQAKETAKHLEQVPNFQI